MAERGVPGCARTAAACGVALLLLLCVCVCACLPATATGALVTSGREAPVTQVTKDTMEPRSIKKRSTHTSANLVEVYSVRVACAVMSRFARTVVTSKALNKANVSQEIFFKVELPKTAFITNFSMTIEGQVYVGEVKEKEKAKKEYEKAVSSGKTAGLVKASGRSMELFSVSVNIAAGRNVIFVLTYEELLQRKLGQYEIVTRVRPEQPVQEFQIVADIYEPQGITFVEASATFLTNDLLPLVEKAVTDTKAHISFSPTPEQQSKCAGCEGSIIDGDFVVNYDVRRQEGLGEVQIVNGYFVHFFAPPDLPRVPKNVVFVIDRSGSMDGEKIRQTRAALGAILKELHQDDSFAMVVFDSTIETWRDTLTKATEKDVSEAIIYGQSIRDQGATNLNGAMLKAVSMLVKHREEETTQERSMDMIILLTDGMPNHGVSDINQIRENVRQAAGGNLSLFSLGFGNNVDIAFLDALSKENKGLARKIYEGSDAVLQLKGFYNEVSSPLLSNVDLRYPDNAVDVSTRNHFGHLFNGTEIVVAGRLRDDDMDNFLVEVFAQGPDKDFTAQGKPSVPDWDVVYPEQEYIFGDFTERLWAYLTTRQLLENSDIGSANEKATAKGKAMNMSLRYGFVTPLTSMVVTKPETEDGPGSPLIANKLTESQRQEAERNRPADTRTPAGSSQRHTSGRSHWRGSSSGGSRSRGSVDGDPHFMIELPDRDDALCFNINQRPGTILNLVRDPKSGFEVNGKVIGKKKVVPDAKANTYFGRFGISHQKLGLRLEVSIQDISVFYNGKHFKLLWSETASIKETNMDVTITQNSSLTVTLRHFIKFMVVKHTKVWKRRHNQQDYLGFYTLDSHHVPAPVHGLLGQFYHGVEFEVTDVRPDQVRQKLDATMLVKGHAVNVTRHWQKDFSEDVKNGENILCWFVDDDGAGLIDGQASDYVVPGLFKTIF